MTGNKSGALLLTIFVLTLCAAMKGFAHAALASWKRLGT
jgi:hypothetical protein